MAQTPWLHFIFCPWCVAGLQGPSGHLRKVLYVLRADKDREPACDGAWARSCPEVGTHALALPLGWHHLWGALPVSKRGWKTGVCSQGTESSGLSGLGLHALLSAPPVDSSKPRGQQQVSLLRDCLMLSAAEGSQQGRDPSGSTLEQRRR